VGDAEAVEARERAEHGAAHAAGAGQPSLRKAQWRVDVSHGDVLGLGLRVNPGGAHRRFRFRAVRSAVHTSAGHTSAHNRCGALQL